MALREVTKTWDDCYGNCYDCGDPAAFVAPNLYGNGRPISTDNIFCSICAAQHACDGERIMRLFVDDMDPVMDENHFDVLVELGIFTPFGEPGGNYVVLHNAGNGRYIAQNECGNFLASFPCKNKATRYCRAEVAV